jgi:hypothetical protein
VSFVVIVGQSRPGGVESGLQPYSKANLAVSIASDRILKWIFPQGQDLRSHQIYTSKVNLLAVSALRELVSAFKVDKANTKKDCSFR